MLTEIGRADYPLPDHFGKFLTVTLAMGNDWIKLTQISPADMDRLQKSQKGKAMPLCGVPIYYAVTDRMVIYPSPYGEWEIARCWDEGEK